MKFAALVLIGSLAVGCKANAQEIPKASVPETSTSPSDTQPATPGKPVTPQSSLHDTASPTEPKKTSDLTVKSIADTLKAMPECSEFVKNAEKCDVFNELTKDGPLTVLVPVNSAYEALPDKIRNNEQKEKAICRFHVLKGDFNPEALKTTREIETFCDEGKACTMDFIEVTQPVQDVILKEIPCNNGRIYLVDMVLIPGCCKEEGIMSRAGRAIEEGVQDAGKEAAKAGEAIGEGARNFYEGSRKVIGSGLEDAGKGLQKASEYVKPSNTPTK